MTALNILLWIFCFLAFLLVQALFINGVKTSMDGGTEILPNGKHKDSEMILYPFYKWLTQMGTPANKRIYYEGKMFKELMNKLYVVYKNIMPGQFNNELESSYLQFEKSEDVEQMRGVANIIKTELNIIADFDGRHVRFYKEYDNYRFGKYARKPFGQCIKCMASVYSIPLFWPAAILIFGFQWWLIPVYVLNVFCLTYVNYLIFKK